MAEDIGPGSRSVIYVVDPHYTFYEDLDPGVSTGAYSAQATAEAHVMPAQTGPLTGLYDPEWAALMSIEA